MSNIYRHGLEKFCELGVCQPTADRVLLRAVMAMDGTGLEGAGFDTKAAVCHQIVATGPEVPDFCGLEIGLHCVHISTAGDTPDPDSKQSRYVIVRAEDIILVWDHEKAKAALQQPSP